MKKTEADLKSMDRGEVESDETLEDRDAEEGGTQNDVPSVLDGMTMEGSFMVGESTPIGHGTAPPPGDKGAPSAVAGPPGPPTVTPAGATNNGPDSDIKPKYYAGKR